MFICIIWLFDWYFAQFCTSDMSKYGYFEVFQRVHSTSRYFKSKGNVAMDGTIMSSARNQVLFDVWSYNFR